MRSILLLAHGSRDPQWVGPFETVRAMVEARAPECLVALAYLEHSAPDLMTAIDQLVALGAAAITIVPLFLGPGGHVRSDVPQLVERATAKYSHVRLHLRPFVGDAQKVLDAIADYAASDSAH